MKAKHAELVDVYWNGLELKIGDKGFLADELGDSFFKESDGFTQGTPVVCVRILYKILGIVWKNEVSFC